MTNQILDKHFEKLDTQLGILNELFINNLNQEHLNHVELLKTIGTHLKSIADVKGGMLGEEEWNEQIARVHSQNLEALNQHFTSINSESFLSRIIEEFTRIIDQYLEETPDTLKIEYPLESFKVLKEDPFRIKAFYRFETWLIQLQEVLCLSTNLLRRPSRRRQNKAENRVLRVHPKKLIQGYFFPIYMAHISNMVKESQTLLITSYLAHFESEHAFIQNGYTLQEEKLSGFEATSININAAIPGSFFDEHKMQLRELIQRSGLFLSMNLWRTMGRKIDFNKSRESLIRLNRSWQSTFFAFFEDWRFREQLYAYKHAVQSAYLNVKSIYSLRIKNSLFPEVEKQLAYTSKMLSRLPEPDISDMEAIHSFFVSELYQLKKGKINEDQQKHVIKAAEDIPKLLLKMENELSEKLDIFPEKVGVVSNQKFINGVKPSEISYFSPNEFIDFEYIRDLRTELGLHRSELGEKLHMIVNEFNEYDQIIDFYLDSTISLTEKPGMGENEVISFFKDGLQRLLNISNRIAELLNGLLKEKLSDISALVEKYLQNVAELDNNDNIINIYARLLKSKTLAESRSKREKLAGFTKGFYSRVSNVFTKHSKWLKSSYSDLKKKLRLDNFQEPISSEISNQLTDIQHRIYTLPVIYQHLFENIPVKEFNLFLSRETEISRLNSAYDDWLKDNFSATLVLGENGSGKSSLLHYYSKTLKSNYQIRLFQISRYYYTEDDYYTLMCEIFDQNDLISDQAISGFIASFSERRVVIIDGLERLFIKKVNGFACLQKLLSLIVSSNHQIFWICSVSKYASAYLNKTIALSEHFDYSINMDSLTSRQVRDIVLKRNRLSGYQLNYKMGNSEDDNSKSRKLTQNELEDKFFGELNQFAGSNISLSLNYWLQSIHSIQEDHVEIGDFIAPDFGFLENISPEKAYTLLLVVMHGKISVEQHALIFSQNMDKSYKVLTILKEDSILVKQGEYFTLNGILFRHVVRVLENRNLIH
jgi:transcriptional regulator with XRE-family HTH domain